MIAFVLRLGDTFRGPRQQDLWHKVLHNVRQVVLRSQITSVSLPILRWGFFREGGDGIDIQLLHTKKEYIQIWLLPPLPWNYAPNCLLYTDIWEDDFFLPWFGNEITPHGGVRSIRVLNFTKKGKKKRGMFSDILWQRQGVQRLGTDWMNHETWQDFSKFLLNSWNTPDRPPPNNFL